MQINKLNKQLKPKARREWCFSEESKLVQGKDRTTDKLANRVLASDSKAHRAVNRGESVNRDNPKIHILKWEEERSTVDPLRLDYSMTATRFCAWQEFDSCVVLGLLSCSVCTFVAQRCVQRHRISSFFQMYHALSWDRSLRRVETSQWHLQRFTK